MIQTIEWVKTWKRSKIDAFGNQKVPIELLILAVSRILGRGWFFHDIEREVFIGEETIRSFFQDFIRK